MSAREVGPILQSTPLGRALCEVIQELNPEAKVTDRGAYLRIAVPSRCVLDRAQVEKKLGRPFRFPGDLEEAMSSFQGKLAFTDHQAIWSDG